MPTYDYECSHCGHRFERFEKVSAKGPKACPGCGRRKGRRLLGTGVGAIFKGAGFYTTDYRKSGGEPAKAPEGAAAPKEAAPAKAESGGKKKKD